MTTEEFEILAVVVFAVFVPLKLMSQLRKSKSKGIRRRVKDSRIHTPSQTKSHSVRTDEEILSTPLDEMNWAEFERLLALYFRAQGFAVEETGIGGNDGGVDLVLTDRKTNERTAVQIKWRSRTAIGPHVIRELHSARWNTSPRCLYAILITNAEITQQARKEAEERHIDFWHGGVLTHKLSRWGEWRPKRQSKMHSSSRQAHREMAATTTRQIDSGSQSRTIACVCGSEMVIRHNKQGQAFWGCSTYPKCRRTKNISS